MAAAEYFGEAFSCLFGLEQRNDRAHEVINSFALKHAAMDVAIGAAGFIPIPGAATIALISAIVAQAPLIYTPMAQELAALYQSSPDAITTDMIQETIAMGAIADIGVEFLKDIATDLAWEAGAGIGLSMIPFIGGILAAGLDATIAATLTWRVGLMISAYYQNGGAWIVNRRHTYKLAAETINDFSPQTDNRADLNDFSRKNSTINDKHVQFAMSLIDMMKNIALGREQIREALESKRLPTWVVDAALKKAFA